MGLLKFAFGVGFTTPTTRIVMTTAVIAFVWSAVQADSEPFGIPKAAMSLAIAVVWVGWG